MANWSAGPGSCRRSACTSTPVRSARCTSVAFDAACLRGKADEDPVLGLRADAALHPGDRRAAPGDPSPDARRLRTRRRAEPMRGRPDAAELVRGGRQAPGAGRHLDPRARAGEWRRGRRVPPGPVLDALRLRRGRGADLGQLDPTAGSAGPHGPRGRRRDSGDLFVRAGRPARRARAIRQHAGRSRRPRAGTWSWSPAGSGWRRFGPRSST